MTKEVQPILIYLAGPMDDVTEKEAKNWREKLAEVAPLDVAFFSPAHAYFGASVITARGVDYVSRCVINACSGLLANLAGAGRGFGTIREIEFARRFGKPVAVVGSLDSLLTYDVFVVGSLVDGLNTLVEAIRHERSQPTLLIGPGGTIIKLQEGEDDGEE